MKFYPVSFLTLSNKYSQVWYLICFKLIWLGLALPAITDFFGNKNLDVIMTVNQKKDTADQCTQPETWILERAYLQDRGHMEV